MTDSAASSLRPAGASWPAALGCALAGWVVFQCFGNATLGYIHTRSLFGWWGRQWFDPAADSGQGPLIVGIALWLLWRNLKGNAECRVPSAEWPERNSTLNWRPAVAMVGGLALHLVGYAAQQTRLSIVALLLFTWGVLAFGGGRRWARAAAFPVAFLVFAIPLNVLDTLGFYLRMGVIETASAAAHAVGLAVARSGTQLFAPDGRFQYNVAAACSGVRSLLALAALSLLIGYLNFQRWWTRGALLVLCAPYAFAANVVRILAIVVAATWFGQRAGTVVHEWFGFVVFLIVLGLQLATVAAFRSRIADRGLRNEQRAEPASTEAGLNPQSAIRNPRWPAAVVVFLAAGLTALAAHAIDAVQASPDVAVPVTADGRDPRPLPAFLGTDWIGQEVPVSDVEHAVLPPDTGFARRNYVSIRDPAHQVFVSIVLSGRDRTSIHRPELCLVGQGWTIQRRFAHRFRYPGTPGTIPATVLQVRRDWVPRPGERVAVPSVVAYWFVGRDRVVATNWERILWGTFDRLRHLRSHRWAYVLVQTTAFDGDAAALARLQTVLDQTLPSIEPPPAG